MTAKLTMNQRSALAALFCCTAPWDSQDRSNRLILAALARQGLAERKTGYPVGWVITPAGRAALEPPHAH